MEKIKILYVITSLGLGGAEKLLLSYVRGLNNKKYQSYVCCLREKPDDLSKEIEENAEVINLKIRGRFNPFVVYRLLKVIKKIQPEIIHTHLFQPRIYTTIANLFHNRSILVTHKHSIVNPGKHHIFLFFEMLSILLNKKVVAISESVKQSLKRYEFIPESKIFVLTNCIDYQKFSEAAELRAKKNENSVIIGTVGRLEKVKGISYLLLAMKIILQRFPEAKLEITGGGSVLDELKLLTKKIGISNSVKFFGKLENPIPNYSRMDIFVLPSIIEGFGIVLLEAMAAGVPVVATNVHGIKEVVLDGESGILIPPKNPEAIAEAIMKIIEQPQLAKTLIEKGSKRARLFDIQEHLMKLENFYTSLLEAESHQ
jgi:glycosyltransferase involved in cell wall biosynthesis